MYSPHSCHRRGGKRRSGSLVAGCGGSWWGCSAIPHHGRVFGLAIIRKLFEVIYTIDVFTHKGIPVNYTNSGPEKVSEEKFVFVGERGLDPMNIL